MFHLILKFNIVIKIYNLIYKNNYKNNINNKNKNQINILIKQINFNLNLKNKFSN